jgi:MOSC domain-containing protein YiiM
MARPAIIVGNHKYSGTDAHRTLLSVGSLWRHHMHDVKRDPNRVASVGAELAQSLQLLADLQNAKPDLELGARLEQLGEMAASKIDEIDPQKLANWLGDLWPVMAKLHSADTQNQAKANIGKVVGIQASTNSVPKTSIAHGIVNYDGLDGDRQMARTHHGRPWQALCIWSDEVIAQHANAGHPITRGSAGENITISETDWSKVRPGATLEFGSVKTQVTAYAIPCKKNARWFSDGDYQRLSHELGAVSRVYCLVTQPGSVSVGDIATCK